MAKQVSKTSALSVAFAAAGKADIANSKIDVDLISALQGAFKGRKTDAASYKAFFKDTQRTALLSYLEGRLGVIAQEVARIADLTGHKDGDTSDDRRSFEQEQACTAFRQRWSRSIKRAGIKTPEKRGGATRTSEASAEDTETAPIVAAPTTPSAKDVDPVQHVTVQAAALLAFANKHAKKLPGAYKSAIADFMAAVKAASH